MFDLVLHRLLILQDGCSYKFREISVKTYDGTIFSKVADLQTVNF